MVQMRLDQKIKRRVDVSDVVQDVLVEANRRLRDYLKNPTMAFHLWIRQIAKDRIIDAHRRHRTSGKRSVDREQALAPVSEERSSILLAAELCDPQLTPAAAATQKELAGRVEQALTQLGDPDCEIIVMRHYEHLSNQEIAVALSLTEPRQHALLARRAALENHARGGCLSRRLTHGRAASAAAPVRFPRCESSPCPRVRPESSIYPTR